MSFEFKKYGDPIDGADNGNEKVLLFKLIKITSQAKSLAPVDTTRLKNSIQYVTEKKKGGSDGIKLNVSPKKNEGFVGTPVLYGVYQEFGTRYIPPQPFLRPAIALEGFNKDVNEVIRLMNIEMGRALKKGVKVQRFF